MNRNLCDREGRRDGIKIEGWRSEKDASHWREWALNVYMDVW